MRRKQSGVSGIRVINGLNFSLFSAGFMGFLNNSY